jgi:hypothetical protein
MKKATKIGLLSILALIVLGVNGVVVVAVVSTVVGSMVAAARFVSKLCQSSKSEQLATEEVRDERADSEGRRVGRRFGRAADRLGDVPELSDKSASRGSDEAVADAVSAGR